jgi:hypothetical protein
VQEKLRSDFGGDVESALQSDANVLSSVAFSFLSDTIVLGIKAKPSLDPFRTAPFSLIVAAGFVANVLREATASPPSLSYRGCISYGEFELSDHFIVGPAVDEAAESMDLAQGAFVWLTPSALREATQPGVYIGPVGNVPLVPYGVPMKGGDTFNTFAVSPLDHRGTREEAIGMTRRILETFSGGLDVAIKRQNTEQFLRETMDVVWPSDPSP